MATKLPAFPPHLIGRNSPDKYPWAEWLDGDVWDLEPGKDFHIKTQSMRTMATAEGKRRGFKIRSAVDPDTRHFVLQALLDQPVEPKVRDR